MQMNLQCAVYMGSLNTANKIKYNEYRNALYDDEYGYEGIKSNYNTNSSAGILWGYTEVLTVIISSHLAAHAPRHPPSANIIDFS